MARAAEALEPQDTGEVLSDLQLMAKIGHLAHLTERAPLQTERDEASAAHDALLPELESRNVAPLDVASIKVRALKLEKHMGWKPLKYSRIV